MVYGLMIHAVDTSQTLFFSVFYSAEGNDHDRKIRQQTIMRKIVEEHLFQTQCKNDTSNNSWKKGNLASSDFTEGILTLNNSSLFSTDKILVWKQVNNVAYTIICETLDNIFLAMNFLSLLINVLVENFNVSNNKCVSITDQYSNHPDDIFVILHYLLPGGQLLFTNLSQARFLKQQIRAVLNEKA